MAIAEKVSTPPQAEDLVANFLNPDWWRDFAPDFTVEGKANPHEIALSAEDKAKLIKKMDKEAYVHLQNPGLNSNLEAMRELLTDITDMGLPPVFAFAYDEFWAISLQMRPLVKTLLEADDFSMLPDFWAWRVKPGQAGWKPHRDKVSGSLFATGKPKSVTVWVPLSIAYPLNGCMYILPANKDPIYYNDGQNGFNSTLPDVRALPGEPGDIFAWTQRVFHWGSSSADEHDLLPRQSVAFEYQRSDIPAFNAPLLDPNKIPDFKARMALIAKQILQYTHMYEFSPELVKIAQTIKNQLGMPEPTGKST